MDKLHRRFFSITMVRAVPTIFLVEEGGSCPCRNYIKFFSPNEQSLLFLLSNSDALKNSNLPTVLLLFNCVITLFN